MNFQKWELFLADRCKIIEIAVDNRNISNLDFGCILFTKICAEHNRYVPERL